MATPKNQQTTPDDLPDIGIRWSKAKILTTFFICLLISVFGIVGFLLYQEYSRQAVSDQPQTPAAVLPDYKNYSNDYWGFKFQYPAGWSQVIGSYQEGDYYFASQPINFISELEPGQALLEVLTYNNFKNLSFDDWLKDRQQNYFPQGSLEKVPAGFKNYLSAEYILKPLRPGENPPYWDIRVISQDGKKIYLLILQTDNGQTNQKFQNTFDNIINNLVIYQGFGH